MSQNNNGAPAPEDPHLTYEEEVRWFEKNREALQTKRDSVVSAIRSAFAYIGRGDIISISEAHAIDYDKSQRARLKARQKDRYTSWSEIDIESLDPAGLALSFMDPPSWCFHIPAYITFSLNYGFYDLGRTVACGAPESTEFSVDMIGEGMLTQPAQLPPAIQKFTQKIEALHDIDFAQHQKDYSREVFRLLTQQQIGAIAQYALFVLLMDRFEIGDRIGLIHWTTLIEDGLVDEARRFASRE